MTRYIRLQHIREIALAHDGVIRPTDLGYTWLPGFWWPRISPRKAETIFRILEKDFWVLGCESRARCCERSDGLLGPEMAGRKGGEDGCWFGTHV